MGALGAWLSAQWHAADKDWRDKEPASETRLVGLLLVVTLALLLARYGSRSGFALLLQPHVEIPNRALARRAWWAWVVAGAYILPTYLYCRFVLKESFASLGLRWGKLGEHGRAYLLAATIVLPLVLAMSFTEAFQHTYPFYRQAGKSWPHLLLWELSYGAQFLGVEFLFRGVLLVPMARRYGAMAVAIAVIPYCMIHFGKPLQEAMAAIVAGMVLGVLALRSRSLLGGLGLHLLVAWSMDLLSLWQQGKLSIF